MTAVPEHAWQAGHVEDRLHVLVTSLQRSHLRDWWPLVALAAVDLVPETDLALVLVTDGPVAPRVVAAAGERAEAWTGSQLELSDGILDRVRTDRAGLIAPSVRLSSAGTSLVAGCLVVPLPCLAHRAGALLVGRLPGRRPFSTSDVARLGQLMRRVELSVNWQRRSEQQVRAERLRIAAQAQEHVVAPLFEATMELANVAGAATNPLLRSRIVDTVNAVDGVVAWLRARLRWVTAEAAS